VVKHCLGRPPRGCEFDDPPLTQLKLVNEAMHYSSSEEKCSRVSVLYTGHVTKTWFVMCGGCFSILRYWPLTLPNNLLARSDAKCKCQSASTNKRSYAYTPKKGLRNLVRQMSIHCILYHFVRLLQYPQTYAFSKELHFLISFVLY